MGKLIVVIGDEAQRQQFAQSLGQRELHDVSTPTISESREVEVHHQVNREAMRLYSDVEGQGRSAAAELAERPDREVHWTTPGGEGGQGNAGPAQQAQQARQEYEATDPEERAPAKHSDIELPQHGAINASDPRQILLQSIQQDQKDLISGMTHATEAAILRAQQERPAPAQAVDAATGPTPAPAVEVNRDIPVQQEGQSAASDRALEREGVVDAEFRPLSAEEAQRDAEVSVNPAESSAEDTRQAQAHADTQAQQATPAEAAAHLIEANRTVVITSNEYNADVARLVEQAQQEGQRVQAVVIGAQEGGKLHLSEEQLNAVSDLTRDSHTLSVYAPNDEGQMQMYATSYNDQPKLTPQADQEIGERMRIGIEQRGGSASEVQGVEAFKPSHPAHTKLHASTQHQHGADY